MAVSEKKVPPVEPPKIMSRLFTTVEAWLPRARGGADVRGRHQ